MSDSQLCSRACMPLKISEPCQSTIQRGNARSAAESPIAGEHFLPCGRCGAPKMHLRSAPIPFARGSLDFGEDAVVSNRLCQIRHPAAAIAVVRNLPDMDASNEGLPLAGESCHQRMILGRVDCRALTFESRLATLN
jgi:hypothetical protein